MRFIWFVTLFLIVTSCSVVLQVQGATDTIQQRLKASSVIKDKAITSADDRYSLVMQSDCNLVIYRQKDGHATWASHTDGSGQGCYAVLQSGNLVIFNNKDIAIWDSDTIDVSSNEEEQYRLVMQNDGNVVIYTSDNTAIWASNTASG